MEETLPVMDRTKRAVGGVRTRDLRLGKPTLYQLSYYRTNHTASLYWDRLVQKYIFFG